MSNKPRRDTGPFFEGFPIYLNHKGYPCIWVDGKDLPIHIFVWQRANGPTPPGFEIHHIDLTVTNYELENLEALSKSDHRRVHAGWVRKNGVWVGKPCNGECAGKVLPLDKFYPRKNLPPTARCKDCHNKFIKNRLQDPIEWSKAQKIKHDWYARGRKKKAA